MFQEITMPRKKLSQTKAAKAARRRYRASKRNGKYRKRGCGKKKWATGGNVRWKCKFGVKKHAYGKRKKKR